MAPGRIVRATAPSDAAFTVFASNCSGLVSGALTAARRPSTKPSEWLMVRYRAVTGRLGREASLAARLRPAPHGPRRLCRCPRLRASRRPVHVVHERQHHAARGPRRRGRAASHDPARDPDRRLPGGVGSRQRAGHPGPGPVDDARGAGLRNPADPRRSGARSRVARAGPRGLLRRLGDGVAERRPGAGHGLPSRDHLRDRGAVQPRPEDRAGPDPHRRSAGVDRRCSGLDVAAVRRLSRCPRLSAIRPVRVGRPGGRLGRPGVDYRLHGLARRAAGRKCPPT